MKMGAIVAGVSENEQNSIYDFGRNLGIAFQLQDDYLDAFGNPETFGKQVGGDIIENKKTYLYLKALENATASQKVEILKLFSSQPENPSEKIEVVKQIFENTSAKSETQKAVEDYTNKAFLVLETLSIPEENKQLLKHFGEWLMTRNV